MKEIALNKLYFKDFMGFKEFSFEPDGENCKVKGRNNAGKTTLLTGFLWLIWGENAEGDSQFDIKPLKPDGEPKHHLESTVEGEFDVDGEEVVLKKVYKEKWIEPRGSDEKRFDGHTKDYYIDDVPLKQSEYKDKLEELFGDLNKLRHLVEPQYFNSIHWQSRREILMDMIEGVEPEDVIAENSDLEDLDLDSKTPEERKKQINSRQKEIDEELDEIPTRIDEIKKGEPDIDKSLDELQDELSELKDQKSDLEEQIADLKSSGREQELRRELRKAQDEREQFKDDFQSEIKDEISELEDELSELKREKKDIESELNRKQDKLDSKLEERDDLNDEITELRERYKRKADEKFTDNICPTCEQEIPEDRIDKIQKKLNRDISEELERINKKGKRKREKVGYLEDEADELKGKVDKLHDDFEGITAKINQLEERIEEKKSSLENYKDTEKFEELNEKVEQIKDKIDSEEPPEELEEKKSELENVEGEIDRINQGIASVKEYQRTQSRVEELKSREDELAAKYEELAEQERLVDLFIETKVNMLESSINEKFELVEFKLFDRLVNGSVKPTCETLVKGVSADSTLNTGARIKSGLDIIKTLNEEYELTAPVWIDDCSLLTGVPEVPGQLIELRADESAERLQVE